MIKQTNAPHLVAILLGAFLHMYSPVKCMSNDTAPPWSRVPIKKHLKYATSEWWDNDDATYLPHIRQLWPAYKVGTSLASWFNYLICVHSLHWMDLVWSLDPNWLETFDTGPYINNANNYSQSRMLGIDSRGMSEPCPVSCPQSRDCDRIGHPNCCTLSNLRTTLDFVCAQLVGMDSDRLDPQAYTDVDNTWF